LLFGWGEFPVAPSVCHVNWRTTIITMIKTIIIRFSPFFCFPLRWLKLFDGSQRNGEEEEDWWHCRDTCLLHKGRPQNMTNETPCLTVCASSVLLHNNYPHPVTSLFCWIAIDLLARYHAHS
jgi:hypothetical protein